MTIGLKVGIGAVISAGVISSSAGISYLLSKPKNLKQELEKDSSFKFLNTSLSTPNEDDESWKKLAEKHAKIPADAGVSKISGLDIKPHTTSGTTTPHLGIKQLKEKCEILFKKTNSEKDYEQAKKDAKNWCNKNSSLLT